MRRNFPLLSAIAASVCLRRVAADLTKFQCAATSPFSGRKSKDVDVELLILQSGRISEHEKTSFCNGIGAKAKRFFDAAPFRDLRLNVAFFNDYAENSGYECYRRDRTRENGDLLTHRAEHIEKACRRVPTGRGSSAAVTSTPSLLATALAVNDDGVGWSDPGKRDVVRLVLLQTLDPESTAPPSSQRQQHAFAAFKPTVHTCATNPATGEILSEILDRHNAYVGVVAAENAAADPHLRQLLDQTDGRAFIIDEPATRADLVNWEERAMSFARLIVCGERSGQKIQAAFKAVGEREADAQRKKDRLTHLEEELERTETELKKDAAKLSGEREELRKRESTLKSEIEGVEQRAKYADRLKAETHKDLVQEQQAEAQLQVAEVLKQNLLKDAEREKLLEEKRAEEREREMKRRQHYEEELRKRAEREKERQKEQERRREEALKLEREAKQNAKKAEELQREAERKKREFEAKKQEAEREAAAAQREQRVAESERRDAGRRSYVLEHAEADTFQTIVGDFDFHERVVYDAAGDTLTTYAPKHIRKVSEEYSFRPSGRDAIVAAGAISGCLLLFTGALGVMRLTRRNHQSNVSQV